nr:hypothetical protein [Tanacetum cinerariifolium]
MSRDVLTVGSTMRIPLLYRGEYSQWSERFMNYLEEQMDGEAMINCIKNGDQPLPRVTQVSIAGTSSTEQPPLKDKSMCNKTAKDLWDALARHMLGSEYGKQDRKAVVLYEYETFKVTEGELLLDTYIRYLQKTIVVTSDPLALIAEKIKVRKRKEKVVVFSDSEGSDADDFSELKKITTLLAKAFNQRKFYSKPTNNNLRTSSTSQSANKKQEFVKLNDKKVEKKDDEKKRDMSKVKCYNCKKEVHFRKDCKKVKVEDYEYYKTKMLLAKKDKDEQVLLAEDQAWMESSSDLDQEINANMVFMAQIEKVLSDSEDCLLMMRFLKYHITYLNLKDDYFQEIINPAFDKIDSPFQQTSSLKPYLPTVILEKIIIDLEDEVVSLLGKEKANLETIESLKSKGFESSENVKNKSKNDCQVVEKKCDNVENSKVIAPRIFKLSVSQSVSPIYVTKTSCASNGVENLDNLSSVRRPKPSGVM